METLKRLKVSRRFALRGALSGIGVAMWLPVLEAMCNDHGTAFAQGAPLPTSFGIFYWGNGIHIPLFTPTGTGDGEAWQLSPQLQDFADVKDAMTVVTGLDMMNGVFKGHGWGVVYVLAGGSGDPCSVISDIDKYGRAYETAEATQYMPTIDQIVADAIHGSEPYKSLETGILSYTGLNMGTVSENLAHRGPFNFLPPERDPTALFNRLFSTGAPPTDPGTVPTDISGQLRKSVLDAVLEDANRLKMSLGTVDAQRLEAHMDSIRALEQRIPSGMPGDPGTASCTAPAAPPTTLADLTAKSQAMNRLIASAVACNLTRVYTHLWSGARDDNHYPIVQLDTEHHELTHGDATANSKAATIEKYVMSQYADLARVMKETPMGAGNVLDNTLIYGISEVAEPGGHLMTNYHIVLMGHAGGQLPGNRHYNAPGRKVTELQLTMQQVMGLQVNNWGSWDNTSTTMPEILA